MKPFAFIIMLALFSPGHAATDEAKIRDVVDTAILPLLKKYDVPGMAVAVSINGKSIFLNYGVSSKQTNTPVTENTIFEIGSVSKAFTATLALYAQERGSLSMNDHPGTYLPQLEGSAIAKASLLNLGTYTAGGLPLQFPEKISKGEMLEYFRRWKSKAAPGTQRLYSNPSIGLLGHITALALQRDFAETMENELFPALGLNHSYIHVPNNAMGLYAWGYNETNQPVRVNPGLFDAEAYGVKSTSADMLQYVQVNMDPSQLKDPFRQAVLGTQQGYFTVGDMVQGLGWEQYAHPAMLQKILSGNSETIIWDSHRAIKWPRSKKPSGPVLYNKTGSTGGFSAYVAFIPEKKVGIVILANKNYPIPARVKAAIGILNQLNQ
jgi:beta-lactamase class C